MLLNTDVLLSVDRSYILDLFTSLVSSNKEQEYVKVSSDITATINAGLSMLANDLEQETKESFYYLLDRLDYSIRVGFLPKNFIEEAKEFFSYTANNKLEGALDEEGRIANYVLLNLCFGGAKAKEFFENVATTKANFATAVTKEIYRDNNSALICNLLNEETLSLEETETKKVLKIPVYVIGEYSHPDYGKVDFSETVTDKIIENFNSKVIGFEPPVFLGHPIDTDTVEGHASIAFTYELFKEDGVLWSYAESVDANAYEKIKSGQYRYASCEVTRVTASKKDGTDVGPSLIGLAITNRPFIPDMPRVEAMSITTNGTQIFSLMPFNLANSFTKSDLETDLGNQQMENQKETSTQTVEENKKDETQKYSADIAEQFLKLAAQVEEARLKAEYAEAKLKELERQDVLKEVDSYNLSASVKQEFREMFSNGLFSADQTKKVMGALQKFSDENNTVLLSQHGSQETTKVEDELTDENIEIYANNPYKKTIEANQRLAKAKQK